MISKTLDLIESIDAQQNPDLIGVLLHFVIDLTED